MSNISVTTNQNVIAVTEVNGITVTTPTGQVIDVSVPNSSVAVTNVTDDITVLTSGTLNINSSGVITSVNGNTGPIVVLTTTDINEGTNLYYTTARANSDFDTRLATKSTTNLAEGTNLYYTTARSNSDFDTRLATKDTDDLAEGSTNLYYTATRFNSAFAGKTTSDLTEGTNLYYTTARFDTRFATKTTDNLNEGTTNQYFTNTRARLAISSTDLGGDGSLSYDNSTGVITYTGPSASEVRAHFTGGTGVTITNGSIAIGQSVATTDAVTFNSVSIDSRASLDTATLTTSATTADQVLDSFAAATYRTAKYVVSIASGSDYQAVEILVVHDGTTASQTVYADIVTNTTLATFSADISGGAVRLLTTPTNAVTVYKVTRTAIVV